VPACLLADLREEFPAEELSDEFLNSVDGRIAAHLGKDYERPGFVAFVRRRRQKGKISSGLLFSETGLAAEYCGKMKRTQKATTPETPHDYDGMWNQMIRKALESGDGETLKQAEGLGYGQRVEEIRREFNLQALKTAGSL
jgi:hypothetical protein